MRALALQWVTRALACGLRLCRGDSDRDERGDDALLRPPLPLPLKLGEPVGTATRRTPVSVTTTIIRVAAA
jgi:hypothetical protein